MPLDYLRLGGDAYRSLGRVHAYVAKALEPPLLALVYLRISQINGCAYCVDLHWHEALQAGLEPRKLNLLAAWFESDAFAPRERVALAWADALTRLAGARPDEKLLGTVQQEFGDQEAVDLTYAIAVMNAFNRLVGFQAHRSTEGSNARA